MGKGRKKKSGEEVKVFCAYDEMVEITKLIANPRNPNTHPAAQIELLGKIIKVNGWRAPITVSQRSGFIVRGHGRYLSAVAAGLESVPVDFQDYASEAEEWADLIADNRIAELSELSMPKVRELLMEMDTGEIDLTISGFDDDELERLMAWAPDEGDLPDELPDPGLEGEDDTMGKLILVYATPEERGEWLRILGLEGTSNQVVFSLADLREDEEGQEGGEG